MRAVMVNAPEHLVELRRRRGLDKKDERWAGEWHLVNPPKRWHARLNADLFLALAPLAKRSGLEPYGDNTGLLADLAQDWRVPDQAYARRVHAIEEGLVGAELVVEIYSPGDESYDKLAFYAGLSVTEVLIVREDRTVERHRLGDDGSYVLFDDGSGTARCATLGVTFTTVEGPYGSKDVGCCSAVAVTVPYAASKMLCAK